MIPKTMPFFAPRGNAAAPNSQDVVSGAAMRRLEEAIYHLAGARYPSHPASISASEVSSARNSNVNMYHMVYPLAREVEYWFSFLNFGDEPTTVRTRVWTLGAWQDDYLMEVTRDTRTMSGSVLIRNPLAVSTALHPIVVDLHISWVSGPAVIIVGYGLRTLPLRAAP